MSKLSLKTSNIQSQDAPFAKNLVIPMKSVEKEQE